MVLGDNGRLEARNGRRVAVIQRGFRSSLALESSLQPNFEDDGRGAGAPLCGLPVRYAAVPSGAEA